MEITQSSPSYRRGTRSHALRAWGTHSIHTDTRTGETLGQGDLGAAQRATAKGRYLWNPEGGAIAVRGQHPLLLDVDRGLEVGANFCRPRKRRLARDGVHGCLRQPGGNSKTARHLPGDGRDQEKARKSELAAGQGKKSATALSMLGGQKPVSN
jgi:hypothetical protein